MNNLLILFVLAPLASANLIYDPIVNIIRSQLLVPEVIIGNICNETWPVSAEGVRVLGLDGSYLSLEAPAYGYNIDNLTVAVPAFTLDADQYTLASLNLLGIQLQGQGPLKITVSGLKVYARMTIKYLFKKFVVKSIEGLTVSLDSAQVSVANLESDGCSCVSGTLNTLASAAIAPAVQSFNGLLQRELEAAQGQCTSQLELLCSLIGTVITQLKTSLIG